MISELILLFPVFDCGRRRKLNIISVNEDSEACLEALRFFGSAFFQEILYREQDTEMNLSDRTNPIRTMQLRVLSQE